MSLKLPESEGCGWYIGVCSECNHRIIGNQHDEPFECGCGRTLCENCQIKNNISLDMGCEGCMIETEWGFTCCGDAE